MGKKNMLILAPIILVCVSVIAIYNYQVKPRFKSSNNLPKPTSEPVSTQRSVESANRFPFCMNTNGITYSFELPEPNLYYGVPIDLSDKDGNYRVRFLGGNTENGEWVMKSGFIKQNFNENTPVYGLSTRVFGEILKTDPAQTKTISISDAQFGITRKEDLVIEGKTLTQAGIEIASSLEERFARVVLYRDNDMYAFIWFEDYSEEGLVEMDNILNTLTFSSARCRLVIDPSPGPTESVPPSAKEEIRWIDHKVGPFSFKSPELGPKCNGCINSWPGISSEIMKGVGINGGEYCYHYDDYYKYNPPCSRMWHLGATQVFKDALTKPTEAGQPDVTSEDIDLLMRLNGLGVGEKTRVKWRMSVNDVFMRKENTRKSIEFKVFEGQNGNTYFAIYEDSQKYLLVNFSYSNTVFDIFNEVLASFKTDN